MLGEAPRTSLTRSQAACLTALKLHRETQTGVALLAGLDLDQTATALQQLQTRGLAERNGKRWRPTARGGSCRFMSRPDPLPDRVHGNRGRSKGAGQRLLAALDRPMRGRELAERLGVSPEAVRAQLVKLYAQRRVRFGDPDDIMLIVARANGPTPLLSSEQERALTAMPAAYATTAGKLRIAAHLPQSAVTGILDQLVDEDLVVRQNDAGGEPLYRVSATGLEHPQYVRDVRRAAPPPLPVRSDRVQGALWLLEQRALRTRDLSELLDAPYLSINALMQYFKRKGLARKVARELHAPYSLTDHGRQTLAELVCRR